MKKVESRAAMGWRVERLADELIVRHGGELSNCRAEMILVPRRRLGVGVLSNGNNGLVAQLGPDQLAPGVRAILLSLPPSRSNGSCKQFYGVLKCGTHSAFGTRPLIVGLPAARTTTEQGQTVWQALLSVCEIMGPVALLKRWPRLVDTPWPML